MAHATVHRCHAPLPLLLLLAALHVSAVHGIQSTTNCGGCTFTVSDDGILSRTGSCQTDCIYLYLGMGRNIKNISAGAFDDMPGLQTLHLHINQLTSLPAGVFSGLSSMQELSLNSNHFTSFPPGVFSGLSSLTKLFIDASALTLVFQDDISVFDNLTYLSVQDDLPQGNVTKLPEGVFSRMSRLREMRLDNVDSSFLYSDMFMGLSGLQQLDMFWNYLTSLPVGVFNGLSSLQTLELSHNRLSSLSEGVFNGLSSLQTLTLYSNRLSSLSPNLFNGMSSMQRLDLSSNFLTSLPSDLFNRLSGLQSLSLSYNQIANISLGAFHGLSGLQSLDLGTNQISSLPKRVFNGLSALQTLTLSYNKLECISSDAFASLPLLSSLYLYGNSLITCYDPSWPSSGNQMWGLPLCINQTVCLDLDSSDGSPPSSPSPSSCSLTASWPTIIASTLLDPSDQPSPYITGTPACPASPHALTSPRGSQEASASS